MKRICLYDMDRVLLIFLLLADLEKDEITYITYEDKCRKLEVLPGEKIILENKKMYSRYSFFNRFKMSKYIGEFRQEHRELIEKIKNGEIELYGMDNLELGRRVFYKDKINVIEEGVLNYSKPKKKKKSIKNIVQRIIGNLYGIREREEIMGYGTDVKKVILTSNLCTKIPVGLENKAIILDMKKLWNKKTDFEKEKIKDVFGFKEDILKKISKESVVLFTQPLSEDGILSEEEKISIYKKVIAQYEGKSIIIKTHPREKTDYSKIFIHCYVMKEKYPVELLSIMGIEITTAVTLFSTAVFGLGKDVQIDFYGTEIHKKLFTRFGSCDNIMVRNKFI